MFTGNGLENNDDNQYNKFENEIKKITIRI